MEVCFFFLFPYLPSCRLDSNTRVVADWDRGYQHTAYFLQYLEGRFGEGTVRRVNEKLRLHKYHAKPFWTELLGRPVEQLYHDYCGAAEKEDSKSSHC